MLLALISGLIAAGPVDVKQDGAFGFPQHAAEVVCDTADLRLSWYSDDEHLYVQAVLWKDADDTLGLTRDGRKLGDWSNLRLDLNADGESTDGLDRDYALNPWPSIPGLRYSISAGPGASSGLKGDSKGRGAINYVDLPGGGKVRVECFLIPLAEIGRKPGNTIKMAYWGWSPKPELTVNSVGFERDRPYYSFHLPPELHHEVKFGEGGPKIDPLLVPEGRETIDLALAAPKPMPEIGSKPPSLAAEGWLNWAGPAPTLESLKGKVVVVEFWATWCGPCVAGIPKLNDLHAKHEKDGLVLLSMTDQAESYIREFITTTEMRYALGVGSEAYVEYGVTGIPYAFVIGRDGLIRWRGYPSDMAFVDELEKALEQAP